MGAAPGVSLAVRHVGGCCLQVAPEMWDLSPCGIHCCQCQESEQLMSYICGPLRSLTMWPLHTWPLVSPHWPLPLPLQT